MSSVPLDTRNLRLRVAAIATLIATALIILTGVLHGALSAGTDEAASATIYEHVLATPAWPAANLFMLIGLLGWLAAFAAIENAHPAGGWIGRLATSTLAIGIAASTLLFLIDTVAIPELAEQWDAAGPQQQATLVAVGDALQSAIRTPLFDVLPLFVFGLPFALFGIAYFSARGPVPRWIAAVAAGTGTTTLIAGITWSLGSTLIPEMFLWAVALPLLWTWGAATGIALLLASRPARRGPADEVRHSSE